MIVYLFRHGQTSANEQHLYCGSTDLPLTQNSVDELKMRHIDNLDKQNFRFISSGLKRCNQTLELLFGVNTYEIIPDFREIDFGIFEMKSYEQLKENLDYQVWISGDNFYNVPPQGESGSQMTNRILPALDHVLTDGRDAVIVTHGGVISAIMQHLFPWEEKNIYQWQPKPGFGYKITNFAEDITYEKIDEFYTGR